MSDQLVTGLLALVGIVVTYVLAPRMKDRREAKLAVAAEKNEQALTLAQSVSKDLQTLLEERKDESARLRADLAARDTRIELLEQKVTDLQNSLAGYQMGVVAPSGYVVIPLHLWTSIREAHPTEIPGRYAGEDRRMSDRT